MGAAPPQESTPRPSSLRDQSLRPCPPPRPCAQAWPVSSRDGTPGSQSVAEKFAVTWETVIVSSHGAVVVKCDGRGSGFQGTRLLHEVRRRLGSLEEKDQMEAVR